MQIYCVTVEYSTYVAAESEAEAREIGISSEVRNELNESIIDSIEAELEPLKLVPNDWRNAYPYRKDNTTPKRVWEYYEEKEGK
jgi:hypothetical protein